MRMFGPHHGRYILDSSHLPTPCLSLAAWGEFMSKDENRLVEQTMLPNGHFVSTVFLGLDHNLFGRGDPVLWETMIFPGQDYQERYTTWEEAKAGHAKAVALASAYEPVNREAS